ncbi:MAG: AMP-binding protein [Crocinitomix sp.]|nr:AMP-binding protein [Crocinitomix sp.]
MNPKDSEFAAAHSYKGDFFDSDKIQFDSIIAYLKNQAAQHPDNTFITEIISTAEQKQITFSECCQAVLKWAAWAKEIQHLEPEQIVGIFPANNINSILAILGILSCDCAILFLNPVNPILRNEEQIALLDVKTVFIADLLSPEIYPRAIKIPNCSDIGNYEALPQKEAQSPLSDIFYFGTSGSTASSKIVAQSSVNAIINAIGLKDHHQLDKTSRILGCLPIYHVNGLHFTVLSNLISGAQAFITHDFNPFHFPKFIEQFKPTIVSVVPSILEALLKVWKEPKFSNQFKYFVTAAAPLSTQTVNEVYNKWNKRVMQGYGLTETTNFSTLLPINISHKSYKEHVLDVKIPSIGKAVYGNEVEVLNAEGLYAEEGEIGEICMRGFNIMNCYIQNDEATKLAFMNGWFHSGDLGYYKVCEDSEEKLFFISGRIKNVAKVKGIGVSLEEIERLINEIDGIKDTACVYVQKKYMDEEIILVICYDGNKEPYENDFFIKHLKTFIPVAVLPKKIITRNSIPRTLTGKLKRRELIDSLTTL